MNKLALLASYWRTKRLQRRFRTREELASWQEERVKAFLRMVKERSPFYRSQSAALSVEDWQRWPVMDKTVFMDEFDRLNTLGISRDEAYELAVKAELTRDFSPKIGAVTVGLSSGTSGNRGVFLVSDRERSAWAGAIMAKVLPEPIYKKQRIAFFLRANSNLYETVQSRRMQFHYLDLLDPMERHITRLQELQPTVLAAPPSMLRMIAEAIYEGGLRIKPKKVISIAEVLEPLDERFIREAFRTTIHQVYQCTEGFLASSCPHGTLHINEDLLVIQPEFIDAERRRFLPVITDFSRTSQPIIRYRLNDILTYREEPCPCGSVFRAIDTIEGRMDDLFYGLPNLEPGKVTEAGAGMEAGKGSAANGPQGTPIFPDFIRRAVLLSSEEILEYRVHQRSPLELEAAVKLSAAAGDKERVEERVRQELVEVFRQHGCQAPAVHFTAYRLDAGPTKLRRIKREYTG